MKNPDENIYCVACQATLTKHTTEHHHFPIPKRAGGKATVPLCKVCHDHVDRLPIDRWPMEWVFGAVAALTQLPNRETRLLLMKLCAVCQYNRELDRLIAAGKYPDKIESGWAKS